MENTLLQKSGQPFGAPEFDRITKDQYLPAFREAVALAEKEVDIIASNPEMPTFSNTIEALEYSGSKLSEIEGIFFNLLEADSDEEMDLISEEVSPMLVKLQMHISLNDKLFERVRFVYENPGDLGVSQKKLLEDTYKSFTRGGAGLQGNDKEKYSTWSEELSLASLKFSQNSLEASNSFELHLTDRFPLDGLPEYVVEAGAQAAKEKGKDGWIYTLEYPSYSPFMKYSTRRDLREKMWKAYNSKAIDTNSGILRKIVDLRMRISFILGYPTYADYALERRMAKTPEVVNNFLKKLMESSLTAAKKEVGDIYSFAKSQGFDGDVLMPWDFSYWSEKYQKEKFDLDEALLKPYFQLENCIDAVFGLAGRLYGISFEERKDIPVYHEDVKVYDVKDADGEHLSLFYADFFPRKSKRGGAWMTEFRGQYEKDGVDYRPFISIVTNFSKPTADTPSLLTHDELTTFLHEFGHALHGMLAKGRYPSQSGTNVARDFVELPSQIMENWAFEPEFLNTFARHYKTGETIPAEYVDRIVSAKNYLAAYLQVRQLRFGILDMAWHSLKNLPEESPEAFENKTLMPYDLLPAVAGTCMSPSFGHIFSGGYSAGYYSYKWAEVLEADAFSLFKETGIFNKETAAKFRDCILSKGSTDDENVLYRNFRGHDPEPDALIEKLGIK